MNRRNVLALVPVVLVAAACGTQGDLVPEFSKVAHTTPVVQATPVPTSTAEVTVKREWTVPALVTGVRYARHKGFDRVVIDLKKAMPGYTARWVKKLTYDGSGNPVKAKGKAYLSLTLAWARAHDENTAKPTWKGGPIFKADLGNITHVVNTGDFEGQVGVGLVLKRKAAFRITELKKPYRLVIDVAH
ncbi:AMIN-like domain-containing (lipo)protein [Acrocarpospora catenulata]|uniref:AMIN-like domain-containing (lipo)protein n=1 Tax=Acrocarpospora catenulata TaxID=2836182 RepID=UPI001BDB4409|nr:hypothetical protein [Acrocarpospora catenulata]